MIYDHISLCVVKKLWTVTCMIIIYNWNRAKHNYVGRRMELIYSNVFIFIFLCYIYKFMVSVRSIDEMKRKICIVTSAII